MLRTVSIAATATLCLGIGSAAAQQANGTAAPLVITITKLDCSRLIQHIPAPDVAYKPGVDVHGRPVVSADADPAQAEFARKILPDVLEIPITINPINYGARNLANQQKANAATAVSQNTAKITAAKATATTLSGQLSTLNTKLSSVNSSYSTATAANVAATGGSSPTAAQSNIRSIRQKEIDAVYTLQSQDTTLRSTYADTNIATEGTLAGLSAKGLDATQMKVGTVKYDIARNSFTFNDQPMLSDDQRKLAEACARQGVR